MLDHILFRSSYLYSLDGTKRLTQETCGCIEREFALTERTQQTIPHQPTENNDADKRDKDHEGNSQIDPRHNHDRDGRRVPFAYLVGNPGWEVGHFAHIFIEVEAV